MALSTTFNPPFSWTTGQVACFLFLSAQQVNLLPGDHKYFLEADVDGSTWLAMTSRDFQNMGIRTGSAVKHYHGKETWRREDIMSVPEATNKEEDPLGAGANKVSIEFIVENLLNVDEDSREMELVFSLIISWEDSRLLEFCEEDGMDNPPSDPCGFYWAPTEERGFALRYPNSKEFEIIEDFGMWTVPQKWPEGSDMEESMYYTAVNPERKPSLGMTGYRARGTFSIDLNYRRFPFDKQTLRMMVMAPMSMPRSKIYFHTKSFVSQNLKQHNMWTLYNVSVDEGSLPSSTCLEAILPTSWRPIQ